jgi:hypothetical protein
MYNHVAEVGVYVFMQFLRSVFFALLQPNNQKIKRWSSAVGSATDS